jgi:hypothetical protein
MPARIIPDVYSEVRPRGLAISLPFGLNTVAIIGTAERGMLDDPALITSKQDMYDAFGEPGEYRTTATPEGSELSLSRAGALAFDGGTPQVYFVRIGSSNVAAATRYLTADDGTGSADGYCAALEAVSEGSWGNLISFKVETADGVTSTDGHVAAVGATVENTFDQAAADPGSYLFDTYDGTVTPDTTQYSYLRIPSADSFAAVASPSSRVELQRSSADNYQRTVFDIHHADCGFYKESGEVDPTDILTTVSGELLTQSFWTLDGFPMAGVITRLKKGGTPTVGTLIMKLYLADSLGRPSGSALATSAGIDATGIGATYETIEFIFTSTYNLQPQTYYCIEMSKSVNLDSAGTITWAVDHAATEVFTQGEANFFTGAAWQSLVGGTDLLFHPVFDLAENHCVFIINDWGTDFMGTETKKIIWSEVAGNVPDASVDTLYLTYETAESMKVSIKYDTITEIYYVVDGYDLINDVNDTLEGSVLITADESAYGSGEDNPDYFPLQTTGWQYFGVGAGVGAGTATGGHDGADVAASDFSDGLDLLLNTDAHIILCAGQYSPTVHGYLQTHCINASNDKMERVGVVGHRYGLTLSQVMSSNASASDKRMIFVSPGITTANHGTGEEETVSASYTAALLGGFMASVNPSISSLNKAVGVGGLENEYTNAELEQLIKRKMDPLKVSRLGGYRWAYAATTDVDTSWHEITTVRITDYATRGIRLACEGFIGQKNLISKRNSIKTAVTGFMQNMVADQMLDDESPYTVEVSATRADRVQGVVRVDVSFRPVFAIKYVVVTEYVE